MSVKAVIFDLYGTLVDISTDEEQEELWRKLALFYGYSGAVYEPRELKGAYFSLVKRQRQTLLEMEKEEHTELLLDKVFEELFEKKGVRADRGLVCAAGRMFRACSTAYIRLYPEAKELLLDLRERGISVYLLSNAQRLFTEPELKMLGIYELFDKICISSDVGFCKPSHRFFKSLLREMPEKPGECMMVGNDGEADIRPARELGLKTCYIHSNLSPQGENPPCDYRMEKLAFRQGDALSSTSLF